MPNNETLPTPIKQELTKPFAPAPRGTLDQPDLSAEELDHEVGGCEEWDQASHEVASVAVLGPTIRWVESILGAW